MIKKLITELPKEIFNINKYFNKSGFSIIQKFSSSKGNTSVIFFNAIEIL